MNYSFMTFSTPSLGLGDVLEVARRYGYDGIEPRLDAEHAHGIEVAATSGERRAAREMADRAGVKLACLATSIKYADPSNADEMVRQTHERIDLAGDLAVPAIRVFGGLIPDGISRDQAIAQLVQSLGKTADHAGERGVTICLETHDKWCDPAHVAEVLKRVNHPRVGANWDVMHPLRTGATIDSAFDTLKPWIRHLHIHDGTAGDFKLTPIGAGCIDHGRVVELLKTIDYHGFLSGEWIKWEPYEIVLPRELATMRGYEQEMA